MSAHSVFVPRRFARLLASDAMSIGRDPMLMFAIVLSTMPALGIWLWRDTMDASALRVHDVERFTRYVAPVALLLPAFLIGWVTGFLLLEDRDDGPLLALDVTPIGKIGFLCYRVTVTALVVAALTIAAAAVVTPDLALPMRAVMTLLVAASAVLATLVLPAIARNKVEGLALSKLTNIASVVPLAAIIPSPWRYLGGAIPTFWVGELLDLSRTRYLPLPWMLAGAVVSNLVWAVGLLVLLRRRAG